VAVTDNGAGRRLIKCLVWDLDNTLWDGTLLEGGVVAPRAGVADVLRTLDERGILHSVASRNDHTAAMARLEELKLAGYFLHPQIGWRSKVDSIQEIARLLGIGTDAIAFVDDDPFELDEVGFSLPDVLRIRAADVACLPALPEMNPASVSREARNRRQLYLGAIRRETDEESFAGPREEFFAGLDLKLTIHPPAAGDLDRAHELTLRTNQLNATGYAFSLEELDAFRRSDDHLLLMAELEDRYGSYGKIGLALIERRRDGWNLKLFLVSCRVLNRGAGGMILNYLTGRAAQEGVRLRAEFIDNGRNRALYVAYRFAGFREMARDGRIAILESDPARVQPLPRYVTLELPG
jgi:FkbH-like protein